MHAIIKKKDGRSRLYIDSKETPPIIYGLSDFPGAAANTHYAYKNIKSFGEQGINIVTADSGLHLGWHKRSPYDPEAITAEIEAVMDTNPNAKILLRLHLNPPYWWLRDNPGECVIYRTPEGDHAGLDDGEQDRLIRTDKARDIRASFASEKWIREATEKLKDFLNSIKGTRAGEGLIGIQLAYGMFGEWHQFGVDVSEPMKRRFKRFLHEKYHTVEALRLAWGDKKVDFDTAEYTPEPFYPLDDGVFRDPKKSQQVIDSQISNQKTPTEAILHFAKALKDTSPELLCGAFYGYYLCTQDTGVIGGHLNVGDIYSSSDIDYICGPFCYMQNRLPDGVPMQRAFLESHRLKGKLWLTEMDQFPIGVEVRSGGTVENFEKNVSILRRNALQPLFGGHGFWFYDHRLVPTLKIVQDMGDTASDVVSVYRKHGWWDSPEMMAEIGKLQAFAKSFTERPFTQDSDVLVIHDTETKYYRLVNNPNGIEYKLFEGIARTGVAYDCIYLSELEACEIERYKCIIFADCAKLTPEMREKIKKITAGKTCIFLHATGYCDGSTLSVENLKEVVGMSFEKTDAKSMSCNATGEEITLCDAVSPTFAVTSKESLPLAHFNNGKVAAARLGSSVYISLPYIPEKMARSIFEEAGAHIWCDGGEPVLAASGHIAVNCQHAGTHTIKLKSGEKIEFETSDFETLVFDTKTKKKVL